MASFSAASFSAAQFFAWLRTSIRAKLGRCPKCLRWALLGAAVSWTAYGAPLSLLPNPIVLALALLSAAGFTTLALAHVTRHMYRVGVQLRAMRLGKAGDPRRAAFRLSRRQIVSVAGRAGGLFVLAAMSGFVRSSAKSRCAGVEIPDGHATASGEGVTIPEAEGSMLRWVSAICDTWCESIRCGGDELCRYDGTPVVAGGCGPHPLSPGDFLCQVDIHFCGCACLSCGDTRAEQQIAGHELAADALDPAVAVAQVQAEALEACNEFCDRFECNGKKMCDGNVTTSAIDCRLLPDGHTTRCILKIVSCGCGCV